jgi:hypothetical protein
MAGKLMVNIFVYADDIVLLAPTKYAIEKLLQVLDRELIDKGLEMNINKTVVMEINRNGGKGKLKTICIHGMEIKWVTEFKFLGVVVQQNLRWEQQYKKIGIKMNMLGNMILGQVGKVVNKEDMCYLLETCAMDLYGIEFCVDVKKKVFNDVKKSYHWLIKRATKNSKYAKNHWACMESKMLTWELMSSWKSFILWEGLCKCGNEILMSLFGKHKWETTLGNRIKDILMNYGKDCDSARQLKENMNMYIEGIAILKEWEEQNEEDEEEIL